MQNQSFERTDSKEIVLKISFTFQEHIENECVKENNEISFIFWRNTGNCFPRHFF